MVVNALIKKKSHRKYRNIQRSDLQTPYSKIFTINFLVYLLQLFMNSVCVYVRENCTTFTIFSPAFFTLYSTPAAHVCSVMIYFAIETSMSVSPDFLNHWVCSKGGPCFLVLMPKVWFVPPASGCAPMSSSSHEAPGISLGAWTLRNACWLLHQLL